MCGRQHSFTDSSEDALQHRNGRRVRWHVASDVGHEHNECCLAKVGGLPRHVGPSDELKVGRMCDAHVIWYERYFAEVLEERMAALLEDQWRTDAHLGSSVGCTTRAHKAGKARLWHEVAEKQSARVSACCSSHRMGVVPLTI